MNDNNTGGPITEGAIVQHLAKLRVRMISENLPVPPPLKRGGSSRISTVSNANADTTRSPAAATTHPINPSSGAQSRLLAVHVADSSDALNSTALGKVSNAKNKTKKTPKPMSDEDIESELEDFDDNDSDGEYGRPITRRAKASNQASGKGIGKKIIKEESSDDEGHYFEVSKTGEKRKRGAAHEDNNIHDESDGEDSDDKTVSVSGAGEDFVGSRASFLPAEFAYSSPSSSQAENSLMVTLNWGKAYHGQLASYQMAQLKLFEAGVLTQLPHEEDSDEENNEEEGQGVPITQWNHPPSATENNVASSNMIGRPDVAPAGGLVYQNNGHLDPQALGLDHTNFPSRQTFEFPDAVAQPYQPQGIGLPTIYTGPEHGHFDMGSFGELVQTPVEMSFPSTGPDFPTGSHFNPPSQYNPGSYFNPGMQGSWTDSFDPTGGVGLDTGSSGHGTYAHGAVEGAWPDHELSRYNSDTTDTTQSSFNNGSINADFPHGIPIDPSYGAGTTTFKTDEEIPRPYPSHYDPEDEDHTTQFDTGFKWAILE